MPTTTRDYRPRCFLRSYDTFVAGFGLTRAVIAVCRIDGVSHAVYELVEDRTADRVRVQRDLKTRVSTVSRNFCRIILLVV